jgi:hypothetical protein
MGNCNSEKKNSLNLHKKQSNSEEKYMSKKLKGLGRNETKPECNDQSLSNPNRPCPNRKFEFLGVEKQEGNKNDNDSQYFATFIVKGILEYLFR